MASSESRPPNYGRRIKWLGVVVVLLVGLWTAGWYWVAGFIEREAREMLATSARDGVDARCDNLTVRGYPFRIGIYCDAVAITDPKDGLKVTGGALRSAGQIYDPFRLVAELDGPVDVAPAGQEAVHLEWEAMRASVRLAEPVPERVSVEARAATVALGATGKVGSVGAMEAHMRANGPDLDLAASVEGLAIEPSRVEGRALPVLAGSTDLTIADGVALAAAGFDNLRGRAGTIRSLVLSSDPQTGLTISGPFAIDADGLIDATLTVTFRNPKGLSAVLAAAIPERRQQIESRFAGLVAMGEAPTLPVRITKGRASLGFIRLGTIPPL